MNTNDDLFIPEIVETMLVTVDENDNLLDFDCNMSIMIELHNATLRFEKSLLIILEKVPVIDSCVGNKKNKDIYILIKTFSPKSKKIYRKLTQAILRCITIDGNEESFAVIRLYKGNCMSESAIPFYKDFVTPKYNLDSYKLETNIIDNIN